MGILALVRVRGSLRPMDLVASHRHHLNSGRTLCPQASSLAAIGVPTAIVIIPRGVRTPAERRQPGVRIKGNFALRVQVARNQKIKSDRRVRV
jgi:hypothetical protein